MYSILSNEKLLRRMCKYNLTQNNNCQPTDKNSDCYECLMFRLRSTRFDLYEALKINNYMINLRRRYESLL